MGLKKSLGYSPIGGPASDVSEFDFVADRNPAGPTEQNSIFDEAGKGSGLTLARSFSEKMIRQAAEAKQERVEDRPEKKVASYYLEVQTISRLKRKSDELGVSYSSLVESALKHYL